MKYVEIYQLNADTLIINKYKEFNSIRKVVTWLNENGFPLKRDMVHRFLKDYRDNNLDGSIKKLFQKENKKQKESSLNSELQTIYKKYKEQHIVTQQEVVEGVAKMMGYAVQIGVSECEQGKINNNTMAFLKNAEAIIKSLGGFPGENNKSALDKLMPKIA